MNHGICAFCATRQKWQKYESRDLRFLRHAAKVATTRDLRFLRHAAKVATTRDLRFLRHGAKVATARDLRVVAGTFAPWRKKRKSMNHGICAFCATRQKWQKYESRDLRFLRHAAKVATTRDLRFLRHGAKVATARDLRVVATFAPWRKKRKSMNHGICAFCATLQKWQSRDLRFLRHGAKVATARDLRFLRHAAKVAITGFAFFAPSGKSGKSMNHGICAFCATRQKWQKYESRDLRFLRHAAKVAITGFAFFAPRGKSGKSMNHEFCAAQPDRFERV